MINDLAKSAGIAAALAAVLLIAPVATGRGLGDAGQSAYCVGVLRHGQGALARLGTPAEAQLQAVKLAQRSEIVRASVGRDELDVASVAMWRPEPPRTTSIRIWAVGARGATNSHRLQTD